MRLRTCLAGWIAITAACGGTSEPPVAPAPPPATPVAPVDPAPVAAPPAPVAVEAPDAGAAAPAPAHLTSKSVAIPGVTPPLFLDYLAIDRARSRVWVPIGNTGSADVYDIAGGSFTRVGGFKTGEREVRGKKRIMGPSAASVGDGVVYIGNRATSEVCPVDAATLKSGKCLKLASPTDGVVYVARVREVWVTTPRDQSLTVLDASSPRALKAKTVVKTEGEPEGYAVDEAHGLFFTNLEDKGNTLVIDVSTHKVKASWSPGCGSDGPRGLAFDAARGFLFVACTDHVQVLDAGHDGALLGKVDTGPGVDNLDYVEGKGLLFAAAGKAARLSVIRVDDKGQPAVVATAETAPGARNAVADASGNAYLAAPEAGQLLVIAAP